MEHWSLRISHTRFFVFLLLLFFLGLEKWAWYINVIMSSSLMFFTQAIQLSMSHFSCWSFFYASQAIWSHGNPSLCCWTQLQLRGMIAEWQFSSVILTSWSVTTPWRSFFECMEVKIGLNVALVFVWEESLSRGQAFFMAYILLLDLAQCFDLFVLWKV